MGSTTSTRCSFSFFCPRYLASSPLRRCLPLIGSFLLTRTLPQVHHSCRPSGDTCLQRSYKCCPHRDAAEVEENVAEGTRLRRLLRLRRHLHESRRVCY